ATLAAIRPGRGAPARTRAAIAVFQRALAAFDRAVASFAERWGATDLPIAYRDGGLDALRSIGRDPATWQWTARHQAAVTALTAGYYTDLMGRLGEAMRRARAFLRAAVDATRRPDGPDTAGLLRDHPLDTVVYANSARHPVHAWATSALMWQGVLTANRGTVNTAAWDADVEWMEVADGPECGWVSHPDHDRAHGTIRSVDECAAYPAAHHGCIREFFPRPDLNGRTGLEGAHT
ncbi:MAG TPA: hypothetical protein VFY14_06620, partial [Streptomyces sp.]|nr:hypothetical protein [Streptomyces sp.]